MRVLAAFLLTSLLCHAETVVSIQGADFHLNGLPVCAGREWQGHRVEGLLMNSRMRRAMRQPPCLHVTAD